MPSATPDALQSALRSYYGETLESYARWGGPTLACHLGLSDEPYPPDFYSTLVNTNVFLADKARIELGVSVLDAGCGFGSSSIWLALERGARVVGITLVREQIEVAARMAAARGAAGVTFEVRDFLATGFEEGCFDVVWSLESLGHTSEPRAVLDHWRTLLRPGGRVACITTFRGPVDDAHASAMNEGWVLPYFPTLDEGADLLRTAGFEEVEAVDLTPKTQASQLMLRVAGQRLLPSSSSPVLQGHYRAAIAAAAGLASGSVRYGYIGGRRPSHDASNLRDAG